MPCNPDTKVIDFVIKSLLISFLLKCKSGFIAPKEIWGVSLKDAIFVSTSTKMNNHTNIIETSQDRYTKAPCWF